MGASPPLTRIVKHPLFVLGAPRSGASLVGRALGMHPEAVLAHGTGLEGGLDAGLARSTVVSTWSGHNRRVEELDAIFPECRFVVMSREWGATARSLASAPKVGA